MFKKVKSERGFGLVEVLVALALLGIIAAAFSMGLFASSKSVLLSDNLTTAEGLARTMMEDIKDGPFMGDDAYDAYYATSIPAEYGDIGYSYTIAGETIEAGLQKITVTISHSGVEILELEGYKANR